MLSESYGKLVKYLTVINTVPYGTTLGPSVKSALEYTLTLESANILVPFGVLQNSTLKKPFHCQRLKENHIIEQFFSKQLKKYTAFWA
jgi:hypothetical protein